MGYGGSLSPESDLVKPLWKEGCAEKGWGCWSITASPSSSRGGNVQKKGGVVGLLIASPSPSRGGDVPDGVRVSDEKIE